LPRPFVPEPAIESDPDKLLASPLVSEPAMESEPDIDLRSESFSAAFEDRPREPAKDLARPLT